MKETERIIIRYSYIALMLRQKFLPTHIVDLGKQQLSHHVNHILIVLAMEGLNVHLNIVIFVMDQDALVDLYYHHHQDQILL